MTLSTQTMNSKMILNIYIDIIRNEDEKKMEEEENILNI